MLREVASAEASAQAESTRKMAVLLEKIFADEDWKTDPNKPAQRAQYYQEILEQRKLDISAELQVREALAEELLATGDSRGAVRQLLTVQKLMGEQRPPLKPEAERQLETRLGLAYLRMGEQENCLMHHGAKSCIFPIRGAGMHHALEGAEGAVRAFTAALDGDPHDLESQWLLNIAYMQLGRYPGDVPAKWLVPESQFASEAAMPEFRDVAPAAGLAVMGHSGGAVMEDFDGDGLLDVMVSGSGPQDQLHFFHNNGNGSFSDRTGQAGLTGETGGLNIICADYDNDGHPDVLVLRGGWWGAHGAYPMSLLRNKGDGRFEDATERAGLLRPEFFGPTQTAAWADYDNDGFLDLFVGRENKPSLLFHNNHDGTFAEVGAANGFADMGMVKGVAWGDYNNDGLPDLYVSIKGRPNRLFRNDGPGRNDVLGRRNKDAKHPDTAQWRFTDVTAQAGVGAPVESFTTWFFDYDNDGWPDLFVAGYEADSDREVAAFEMGQPAKVELPRLYRNNHDGTFTEMSKKVHLDRAILIMGANFGDLDNDGWLDVYFGTGDSLYDTLLPNRMFRNDRGRAFQDVTTAGGFGHLQKGHGVAFGDIDNDGDEDVFEEMGGALPGDTYESVLYENPGNGNHWISLELEGVQTNRSAIGARIDVTVRESGPGNKGSRHIFRTVGYGSSFGGNPLRQHIGLGSATGAEEVEVRWPGSKTTQRFRGVAGDRAYRLREGGALERAHAPQFRFPKAAE